jgi:transcriptional regulator with XRE-family HTH domain
MGNPRPKPERLAEKLLQIRNAFGLSQTEMLRRLGLEESMKYTRISEYELGIREPSLMTLLQYARVAGVCLDTLVDDELDLPELPSTPKHGRK